MELRQDPHLLCETAPLAFMIEQAVGEAVDPTGKRILVMEVKEDFSM